MLGTDFNFKVTSHLRALAHQHGCVAFELVEGVVVLVVKESFTVENGLRMPNGSANRKRIVEVYFAEIDACAFLVQDIRYVIPS